MCGIGGVIRFSPRGGPPPPPSVADSIPDHWLDQIDRSISHRGPDGTGRTRSRTTTADGTIIDTALLHRRLSIIDHHGGSQPMATADGSLALVFNGCIYNHRTLRSDLQHQGRRFTTDHSDTESLLHALAHFGPHAVEHLDGMFAFAAIDSASGRLLLGRDSAGEKPLYLARAAPGLLAFASSVPGLIAWLNIAAPDGACPVDPQSLLMWLKHGYWDALPYARIWQVPHGGCCEITSPAALNPDPAALFAQRARVDHRATYGPGGTTPTITPNRSPQPLTPSRAGELIAASVALRLDADVPLGCFLSGGVDSSLIAALAQRALAAQGQRLRTFCVKSPDPAMDESVHAQAVADHLGTNHATLTTGKSAGADLSTLLNQLGLPFGDSSLLPTYWVSAAAKEHVSVALSGDGGDELFAGYDRYTAWRTLAHLRSIGQCLPSWAVRRLSGRPGRIAAALRYNGYHDLLTIFTTPQLSDVLGTWPDHRLSSAYDHLPVPPDARAEDFGRYLPQDLMRKVDTASMAVALEVRAPMLCRTLSTAALNTPAATITAGGRKGLLRSLARTLLPASAIDRPKQGFSIPIGRWFRQDFGGLGTLLKDHLASGECARALNNAGLPVNTAALAAMLSAHQAGDDRHQHRLYQLLVTSLWLHNNYSLAHAASITRT